MLKVKYLELKLEVVWFYGYDKRHFSEKHFFLYPGLKNAVKFAFNEGRSISVKDWMSGLWRLPPITAKSVESSRVRSAIVK